MIMNRYLHEEEVPWDRNTGHSLETDLANWAAARPLRHCDYHHGVRLVESHGSRDWRWTGKTSETKVLFHVRFECPECEVESKLKKAGVPPLFLRATFDSFECGDSEELRRNADICRRFSLKPSGFLLLLGPPGTGKTHLGVSILRTSQQRFSQSLHK